MSETLETADTAQAPENPLLKPWQTPFETPPFAEIRPEHFLAAFEQAFADHAAEVAAITHDPSAPDFSNTITALERSGKLLSKVSAVFYDLVSADSNPALLEIDKEVSLRMARHWNPIMMNAVLFGRIAMLHHNRATLGLTGEETYDIPVDEKLQPRSSIKVTAKSADGSSKQFEAKVRIDTPVELDYYRNGGILQTVLRKLLKG